MKLNLKQIVIGITAIIGALLILIFGHGLYSSSPSSQGKETIQIAENNKEIKVVSTNPDNLDGSTILPSQTISITFNQSIENRGEFKNKIDPKAEYEIKLSDDRKTAQIILTKPYQLGTGYTLFIKSDTKFDGKRTLDKELIYHFNTISYQGV